jgi:hypothetical protein
MMGAFASFYLRHSGHREPKPRQGLWISGLRQVLHPEMTMVSGLIRAPLFSTTDLGRLIVAGLYIGKGVLDEQRTNRAEEL